MKKSSLWLVGLVMGGVIADLPVWAASADPQEEVAKKASILEKMHQKAGKALVNAAQDETFHKYFHAKDEAAHQHLKKEIDQIALNVQSNFNVEEMCLIEANGKELSRIVGKEIATELSADESGASFFKPGLAKGAKTVHVAPPYMSADVNKWVVAYVTPILVGAEKKAILHYEMGLDVYQAALAKELSGKEFFLLAVTADGWVVFDSRTPIAVAKQGEKGEPADYFQPFRFGGQELNAVMKTLDGGGTITEEGAHYTGAYKTVENLTLVAFKKQ